MTRLHINKAYFEKTGLTGAHAGKEIDKGLELLEKTKKKIVTFFGSHQVSENNEFYKHCEKAAYILGKKGYAIMTGGGPGIMRAANTGAMKAKTISLGVKASLLKNEKVNHSVFTNEISCRFLFVRRFILSIKSEALIFYPGGYGTLNELFEYAVLMQTKMADKVPIICVNKKYWKGLFDWLEENLEKKNLLINGKDDLGLLYFVDDVDEIIKIIEAK